MHLHAQLNFALRCVSSVSIQKSRSISPVKGRICASMVWSSEASCKRGRSLLFSHSFTQVAKVSLHFDILTAFGSIGNYSRRCVEGCSPLGPQKSDVWGLSSM